MLRMWLDHHISPAAAAAARQQAANIPIQHVQDRDWQRLPDPELLTQAHREGLTLVTYDLATIPQYLREFAERAQNHGGVVFIDGRTIASDDRGAIGRALAKLWQRERNAGWQNRTYWLTRSGERAHCGQFMTGQFPGVPRMTRPPTGSRRSTLLVRENNCGYVPNWMRMMVGVATSTAL